MGYYWSFEEVARLMEIRLVKGFQDTHKFSKKYKIDMRRAAMSLAVQRVVDAHKLKGIWP